MPQVEHFPLQRHSMVYFMTNVNNNPVRRIYLNGVRLNQAKVNGVVVFNDTYAIYYDILYVGHGDGVIGWWEAYLSVNVYRLDGYPIPATVLIQINRTDYQGSTVTDYYYSPLVNQRIASGQDEPRMVMPAGDCNVEVIINGERVSSWNFLDYFREGEYSVPWQGFLYFREQ